MSQSEDIIDKAEVDDDYNPKGHKVDKWLEKWNSKSQPAQLTFGEKSFIVIGTFLFVAMMFLIHHPELRHLHSSEDLDLIPKLSTESSSIETDLSFLPEKNIANPVFMKQNILGFATEEGTESFFKTQTALGDGVLENSGLFSSANSLSLSQVGIGTYMGESTDAVDDLVSAAVYSSISSGVNVIDTSINYRGMRAERAIRIALMRIIENKIATRDQLFIATKAGFIPADMGKSISPRRMAAEWASQYGAEFPAHEVVDGKHCIAPACLELSVKASLDNLGVGTIDLLYLHNAAEKQLEVIPKADFLVRLNAAFAFLEELRRKGSIRYYGMATWSCFRVSEDNKLYLSLQEVWDIAVAVGGQDHGFRYVQIPLTVTMPEAAVIPAHGSMTFLEQATALGVTVMTSRSIGAGKYDVLSIMEQAYKGCLMTSNTGADIVEGNEKLSQVALALQLTRSVPGVTTALVGMKSPTHVTENLAVLHLKRVDPPTMKCVVAEGNHFALLHSKIAATEAKKKQDVKDAEEEEEEEDPEAAEEAEWREGGRGKSKKGAGHSLRARTGDKSRRVKGGDSSEEGREGAGKVEGRKEGGSRTKPHHRSRHDKKGEGGGKPGREKRRDADGLHR